MIKKIVIGGAAAGLLVAGAASAAKLSTQDETLAAGVVEVSGATLDNVKFSTDWIGVGGGNPQPVASAVKTITFEFGPDDANLVVEGVLIKTDGKQGGYFGPDAAGQVEADWTTDSNGVLTVDISAKNFLVENLGGLNLNVYSS